MKLHSDSPTGLNTVTAYGAGFIEINRERYYGAVAFAPDGEVAHWSAQTVADLTLERLQLAVGVAASRDPFALLDDEPAAPTPGQAEVLLVGTGQRQHFLPPAVLKPLLRAGVGVESMDTQAAARTYNILMAEGRKVVAVLLPTA
ncbi:MAG: Mth938-like domain-containing protein [Pigmentiphaga sp.]